MAVASPAVTPFINVFVPYMGDPAYWEGSVGAADETAATLYLTCPAEEFCSFNAGFRVVTGSDFIEYTASSSGQYTYVTCDDLDGGASETCSVMYSMDSSSGSNAYSIYSNDLFVPLLVSAAYITNGADMLARNTADTSSSLFPFAATATSASSAVESKTASTRIGSQTASRISGTTASTGKASGTGSSSNNGAAAGSGSGSGSGSGAGTTSAKPSASGSTTNNASTTKNAAPGRSLNTAVYGLGGLLASLTIAVAAL